VTTRSPRRIIGALALVIGLVAGCAGGASPSPSAGPKAMVVSDAWARASMTMERAVAVYLVVTNQTGADDALVSAASPAAGTVEMHQTMAGDSGMMQMMPVDRIPIASGASVTLAPGGYHIMLINPTAMLDPGASVELTLTFEHAAPVTVSAEVRAN
jgi:copper(I)-binding protein